jgi:hypothetical protein
MNESILDAYDRECSDWHEMEIEEEECYYYNEWEGEEFGL